MELNDAITREEIYLSVLSGASKSSLPEPITRKEHYLHYLCVNANLGNLTQEQITAAVEGYLDKNGVSVSSVDGGNFTDWDE